MAILNLPDWLAEAAGLEKKMRGNMLICVNCGREMNCYKTGLGARFNNDHVYTGDGFECRLCGIRVINTANSHSYHDPEKKANTINCTDGIITDNKPDDVSIMDIM